MEELNKTALINEEDEKNNMMLFSGEISNKSKNTDGNNLVKTGKNEIKGGCLYVVGTPIGNMADISERAVHTLRHADFIAAEDTRVSGLLLSRLGIKNKLTSYHEHNAASKSETIAARIEAGESCAIITDAGMPCVSDPGELLVRICGERGIPVYAVPGPCALTAALAVSGLDTGRFSFEGFLSAEKKRRKAHLDSVRENRPTLIFYEAPHRLRTTLADLADTLGDRKIAVCRELTKMYEEVIRGTISDIIRLYDGKSPKGEYVLVVAGKSEYDKDLQSAEMLSQSHLQRVETAGETALELHRAGMGLSQAAKTVAEQCGLRKPEVYKSALEADLRVK